MIDVGSDRRQLAVQRLARQADDAEQARHAFTRTLLGPVERRPLRVRIDHHHALPLPGPSPGEVQR